jgi:hypothetical protein
MDECGWINEILEKENLKKESCKVVFDLAAFFFLKCSYCEIGIILFSNSTAVFTIFTSGISVSLECNLSTSIFSIPNNESIVVEGVLTVLKKA